MSSTRLRSPSSVSAFSGAPSPPALLAEGDATAAQAAGWAPEVQVAVAAGGDADYTAILDNYCWGNTRDPQALGELVRASIYALMPAGFCVVCASANADPTPARLAPGLDEPPTVWFGRFLSFSVSRLPPHPNSLPQGGEGILIGNSPLSLWERARVRVKKASTKTPPHGRGSSF